jgi:hypothetical protein
VGNSISRWRRGSLAWAGSPGAPRSRGLSPPTDVPCRACRWLDFVRVPSSRTTSSTRRLEGIAGSLVSRAIRCARIFRKCRLRHVGGAATPNFRYCLEQIMLRSCPVRASPSQNWFIKSARVILLRKSGMVPFVHFEGADAQDIGRKERKDETRHGGQNIDGSCN